MPTAVSRGTSHVTTKQRCKNTTAVDIQKNALCKVTLFQSPIRLERSGSARKHRIALCSCHCEAIRAHLEMSVQINK